MATFNRNQILCWGKNLAHKCACPRYSNLISRMPNRKKRRVARFRRRGSKYFVLLFELGPILNWIRAHLSQFIHRACIVSDWAKEINRDTFESHETQLFRSVLDFIFILKRGTRRGAKFGLMIDSACFLSKEGSIPFRKSVIGVETRTHGQNTQQQNYPQSVGCCKKWRCLKTGNVKGWDNELSIKETRVLKAS